ncbi:MAG: NnrS family protein [Acidobacteria bacterium]|nr:MAG: NnrS family protein [Acidobacteriota bacterium]
MILDRWRWLFSGGFRCFFLGGAIWAVSATGLWLAALAHGTGPAARGGLFWHGHEMLFGFAGAAAAGFALTALPNWTGTPPLAGGRLAAAFALWLAGRAAALAAGSITPAAAALADAPFLCVLAAIALWTAGRAPGRAPLPVPAGLLVLAAADLAFHAGACGAWPGGRRLGLVGATHSYVFLIAVISGRIVPAFTRRLLPEGRAASVRSRTGLDLLAVAATLGTGLLDLAGSRSALLLVSPAAAAVHLVRWWGWRPASARRDALTLVLHAGYAWLPAGYALLAAMAAGAPLPRTAAIHAFTLGAMGTMILGIATRAGLGHTGRPRVAPPLLAVAFAGPSVAAALRIGAELAPESWRGAGLAAAGIVFGAAYLAYAARFAPILTGPRVAPPAS